MLLNMMPHQTLQKANVLGLQGESDFRSEILEGESPIPLELAINLRRFAHNYAESATVNLLEFGRRIYERYPKVANANTLYYPGSGIDFGAPFLLFPQIKRVVGFDDHPFGEANLKGESSVVTLFPLESGAGGYVHVDFIEHLSARGRFVGTALWVLTKSFPKLKIINIEQFHLRSNGAHYFHGIVSFKKTAESNEIYQYIHVHTPPAGPIPASYFSLPNLSQGIVMAKGSMHAFAFPNEHSSSSIALGYALLKKLRESGGLFIDFDGRATREIQERWFVTPFSLPAMISSIQRVHLAEIPIGYREEGTTLFQFETSSFDKQPQM